MFKRCNILKKLNIFDLNLSYIQSFISIFTECYSLEFVNNSKNLTDKLKSIFNYDYQYILIMVFIILYLNIIIEIYQKLNKIIN